MSVFEELKKRVYKNQEKSQQPTDANNDTQFKNSDVRYVVVSAFNETNNQFVKCKVVPFVVDITNGTFTNLITNKTFKRPQPDDKYLFDDISKKIEIQIQDASLEELTFKAARPFRQSTIIKESRFDKLLLQSNLQKQLKQNSISSCVIDHSALVSQSNVIDFCATAENVLTRIKLERQYAKQVEQEKQQKKQARKQGKTM